MVAAKECQRHLVLELSSEQVPEQTWHSMRVVSRLDVAKVAARSSSWFSRCFVAVVMGEGRMREYRVVPRHRLSKGYSSEMNGPFQ